MPKQLFCGDGPKTKPLRRPRQTSLSSPCQSTSRSYPPRRNYPLASTFWRRTPHCCGHGRDIQQRRRLTIWHAGGRGKEAKRGGGGRGGFLAPHTCLPRQLTGSSTAREVWEGRLCLTGGSMTRGIWKEHRSLLKHHFTVEQRFAGAHAGRQVQCWASCGRPARNRAEGMTAQGRRSASSPFSRTRGATLVYTYVNIHTY